MILLDYQVPGVSASVNSIKISPDLKIAHAYISVWGTEADDVFANIERRHGEISKTLATKLKSKNSPSIKFHLDTGQTEAEKIQELLK